MRREIIICCVCLGLAGLILAGRTGYQFYQADQARKQEQIRRAAMATAMTQARAELARQQEAQRLAAAAGTPAAPSAPAGSRPAAPAGDPDVASFLGQAKINSVLLGSPSIVVINKHDYEEGHQIVLPHGKRLTVKRIADDDVTLTGADGQTYRLARK